MTCREVDTDFESLISGGVVDMPNVVCIHEQDAGIGWKHT